MSQESYINSQQALWDRQHYERGGGGGNEGTILKHVPNDGAVMLASVLLRGSHILEIGSANGRDARRFAEWRHFVDCIDFSEVALMQLHELADEEGAFDQITSHHHNISRGNLPHLGTKKYDALFARSSLHLDDASLDRLAYNITERLKRNAFIIIEGKSPFDPKIMRSRDIGGGLVVDAEGHVRRVWDEKSMVNLARRQGWKVQQIVELQEEVPYGYNSMMRLAAVV